MRGSPRHFPRARRNIGAPVPFVVRLGRRPALRDGGIERARGVMAARPSRRGASRALAVPSEAMIASPSQPASARTFNAVFIASNPRWVASKMPTPKKPTRTPENRSDW
jgi:hypothetical protein